MPFNVNEFIGSMPGDGARPNLFQVTVVFPPGSGVAGDAAAQLTFKCRAASIPGSTLGTVIAPYFGREIKLAGNRTFEDWTVTVMMDEDYIIREAFEQWSGALNSHVSNIRAAGAVDPSTYMADLNVIHYSKDGTEEIGIYFIEGAWPVSVEPVQLDWAANDQLAEFSVTFAYQWWSNAKVAPTYEGGGGTGAPVA
jgi:hypothetical protein